MNKHFLFLSAILCLVSSACSTTGDPTSGGIFWSPAKARMRQDALVCETYALQSELCSETNKAQNLTAQRERLRAQIQAKKAALRRATSPSQTSTITNEIAELEKQLAKF